ncbi:hypothetical protein EJ110_NYTH03572 [Nymphaea thermarum]|nr:hypothetical protein EJ110_NYTH03572 [Nymphaea thermarum]
MWGSISSHLDTHSSRRIGVQGRELKTRRYITEYVENVLQCIKRKGGFLLKRFLKWIPPGEYAAMFVRHHLEEMHSSMRVLMETTGMEFRLNFQRLDGREVHDIKYQVDALVDMWPGFHTFGYIASRHSSVVPNFLNKRAEEPVAFRLQDMANRTSKLKVCVDRKSGWTVLPRRSSLFPASEN